ncbi:hypothetical protein HY227_01885 [Candidatus Wolfebacteria bacterium]|nr:hypothetical protein [Candidatus Wolfebacteria bacterium]
MTTTTKEKLNTEIKSLKEEVKMVRSMVISIIGRDKEGSYNPKFVKEILSATKEKPRFLFVNPKDFLAKLNK